MSVAVSEDDDDSASLLQQFVSTVFPCDTTPDARYIRCDFKQCSKHVLNKDEKNLKQLRKLPTDYWMLNTEKNVTYLERHVSNEIYDFIGNLEDDECELNGVLQCPSGRLKYELNPHLLCSASNFTSYEKVLVVFNLRDPQSTLGRWIDAFLQAVREEDDIEVGYLCVTLSFSSRKELLKQISRLHSIEGKTSLEVVVVLSCHSSTQGQVFSCTPTAVSKFYNFEEFCSVHDFVCACQEVLGNKLKWIHLSSCYAMKLNMSHRDWPVDYTWYKRSLRCILSGSAKEVYETGSQTGDLFFLLNTLLLPTSLKTQFNAIFRDASLNLFPDLVKEMGLTITLKDTRVIDAKLKDAEHEDKVTKPKIVNSSIHLVILFSNSSKSLKRAICCNLSNRTSSDVKSGITPINIETFTGTFADHLIHNLEQLLLPRSTNIFFLVLRSPVEPTEVVETISTCEKRTSLKVYGVHVNRLHERHVLHLKNNFTSLNFSVTGFIDKPGVSSKYTCPVLLYLVHLVLGENGTVRVADNSSAAVADTSSPVHSSWTLEEVFKETMHVLPGLCEKSNLTLIIFDIDNMLTNKKCARTTGNDDSDTLNKDTAVSQHNSRDRNCPPTSTQKLHRNNDILQNKNINSGNSSSRDSVKPDCFKQKKLKLEGIVSGFPLSKTMSQHTKVGTECLRNGSHDVDSPAHKNTGKLDNAISYLTKTVLHHNVDANSTKVAGNANCSMPRNVAKSEYTHSSLTIPTTSASNSVNKNNSSHCNLSSLKNENSSVNNRSSKPNIVAIVEKDPSGTGVKVFQKRLQKTSNSCVRDLKVQLSDQGQEPGPPQQLLQRRPPTLVRLMLPGKKGGCFNKSRNPPTLFPIYPHLRNCHGNRTPQEAKDIPTLLRNPPPQMRREIVRSPPNKELVNKVRGVLPVLDSDNNTWIQPDSKSSSTTLRKPKNGEHPSSSHTSNDVELVGEKGTNGIFDVFDKDLKDVPLMANVDEVLVYHYNLDLDVNFEEKCINGNIMLFIRPANEEVLSKDFQMCLDCTLIDIESVHEITIPDEHEIHFHNKACCCQTKNSSETEDFELDLSQSDSSLQSSCKSCALLRTYKNHVGSGLNYQTLSYSVFGWCIRIWKDSPAWPRCVYIKYRTKPVGPSLMWCHDIDGNPCSFTPGAYINNRSMMPCQEPPVAMSTWSASISVPQGFVVLSSGDKVECKQTQFNDSTSNTFFFEMSMPLPSSTLAFAFGKFVRSSRAIPVLCSPNQNIINVSLYASQSKIEAFEKEYLELSAKYLKSACTLLGEFPFSRVDLIVMPKSFACLGLQSPNITFLSQSILCGDCSMSTRIAHEISHAWFGLLVGAEDWTEEWLSEGFATYIEDRILAHGQGMNEFQFMNYSQLMQVIRFKTLKGELEQADDDNLKRLRPKKSKDYKTAVDAVKDSLSDHADAPTEYTMVPNAAVSSKKWSQVHYLKGYFLLLYMAKMVGMESFDAFLKHYLQTYAGRLVTSEMFFNLYVEYYSMPLKIKDDIISGWMESIGLPISPIVRTIDNDLVTTVDMETKHWISNNTINKRFKTAGKKRRRDSFKPRPELDSNQLVLLLENLLNHPEILSQTLTQMNRVFQFDTRNSEVRHRWCELIIKHLYSPKYDQVKRFLVEDQGMGIYLFGEMVITCNPRQLTLAKEAFEEIKEEMDQSTLTTVSEIIYGEEEEGEEVKTELVGEPQGGGPGEAIVIS